MDELLELRSHIEQGRYPEALILIGEMEEMGYDDKVNKLINLMQILLLHVIKQHAEKRTARAWKVSVLNALTQIKRTNRSHKTGRIYLSQDELRLAIDEAYESALRLASLEVLEGIYTTEELAKLINESAVKTEALRLILDRQ